MKTRVEKLNAAYESLQATVAGDYLFKALLGFAEVLDNSENVHEIDPDLVDIYLMFTLFISCLYRLRDILILLLKDGRRLLSIKSMTLGDASREAKNSARLGCGLVMDDRPPLYLDATSTDDSFLVTFLQSRA